MGMDPRGFGFQTGKMTTGMLHHRSLASEGKPGFKLSSSFSCWGWIISDECHEHSASVSLFL